MAANQQKQLDNGFHNKYSKAMKQFNPLVLQEKMDAAGMNSGDICRMIFRKSDTLKPSPQAVKQWLSGKTAPSARYLAVLSEVFKCSIEAFFKRDEK